MLVPGQSVLEDLVNMASFGQIYRNKKVLVTGHTGFKGSWLSLWLKALGAEVIGYSLVPPSEPNFFDVCQLKDKLIHIHGDVRNYDHLIYVFRSYNPDFVFHLAAQPLVRFSYENPRTTYETNVMGTVNLLEAVRETDSVRAIINITSDKCYENREWIWGYRETDPMGGHDPYSASKGCAELVTNAWRKSFFPPEQYKDHGVGLASVRAGNVIGGGDWGEDRLLPDCIRALSDGEEIVIRYPKAVRPWQHVLEPLYGYLLLGMKLWESASEFAGAWNFGPTGTDVWSVEQVVSEVCDLWGDGKYIVSSNSQPHEAHWLKLDSSKASHGFGWSPKFTVEKALKKTVAWYKLFYSGEGPEQLTEFTLAQIDEYQGSCT